MVTVSNSYTCACPRCGSLWCESDGFFVFCPSCLLIEEDSIQERGRPSATPSDEAVSDSENDGLTETLGEIIEQVPSDFQDWELSLTEERYLKMNSQAKQDQQEKPVTVFDVLIVEEGKNGKTYWHQAGVAFPLNNGSNGLNLKLNWYPNLRLIIKESVRAVGAAKFNQENRSDEETPF